MNIHIVNTGDIIGLAKSLPISAILDYIKSFIFAWVPIIIIFWILSIRKQQYTKLVAPVLGLILGIVFAYIAGYLNTELQLSVFKEYSDIYFFGFVAINEETVKLAATLLTLLLTWLIYRCKIPFRDIYNNNYLLIGLASTLGFAFAENFIYGISGKGSIVRLVPLVAHIVFGLSTTFGLYYCINKRYWLGLFWGFGGAILIHWLYDILVSPELIQIPYRLVICGVLLLIIILAYVKLFNNIRKQELARTITAHNTSELQKLNTQVNKQPNFFVYLISILCPGLGHIVYRREIFAGMIFTILSIAVPIIVFYCLVIFWQDSLQLSNNAINWKLFFAIIGYSALSYCAISILASIELYWSSKKTVNKESSNNQRFSIVLTVSCLLFASLIMSMFLPIKLDSHLTTSKSDEKINQIIKEVPMGISLDISEIQIIEQDITDDISLLTSPENNKADIKKSQKVKTKVNQSKGLSNSKSKESPKLLNDIPTTGYIGVQLSQMTIQGVRRPYVIYVYPNTSADREGLLPNDIILSIDGKSVQNMPLHNVTKLVKGPMNTSVKLNIMRLGQGEMTFTIYRTGVLFDQ